MDEVKEYFVTGLYDNYDELPIKIYKVTIDYAMAVNEYLNHWNDPKCYVGCYKNNKLVSLEQYRGFSVDGPGIFRKDVSVVTREMIEDFEED